MVTQRKIGRRPRQEGIFPSPFGDGGTKPLYSSRCRGPDRSNLGGLIPEVFARAEAAVFAHMKPRVRPPLPPTLPRRIHRLDRPLCAEEEHMPVPDCQHLAFGPLLCPEEEEEHVPEPLAAHNIAQTLQQPDVSSLNELLDTTTLDESSITATSSSQAETIVHDTIKVAQPSRCLSLVWPSPILARNPPGWPLTFYIRIDLGGSFHTYPCLGGPFQSLQEAENAIVRHLHNLRCSAMSKESLRKLSPMERAVQKALHWPDGTSTFNRPDPTPQLVQALLDKYNEDHDLLGDLAYKLRDVVGYQPICEGPINEWYYHLNFTTIKGPYLFFTEVTSVRKKGEYKELELSCLCMIKPDDHGWCRGCKNSGSVKMKHPNDANTYTGGHLNVYLPFGASDDRESSDSDDDLDPVEASMFKLKAEEDRLRRIFKCLDDPCFLEKLRKLRKSVVPIPNTTTDGSEANVQNTM